MERRSDDGFSLIELIIVVAIMAVLIAVLAPQYVRYVEKARNAVDLQNARAIVDALVTYSLDPDSAKYSEFVNFCNDNGARGFQTISFGGGNLPNPRVDPYAVDALAAAGIDINDLKTQSRYNWDTCSINYSLDAQGTIVFCYTQTSGDPDDPNSFIKKMEAVMPAAFDIPGNGGVMQWKEGYKHPRKF